MSFIKDLQKTQMPVEIYIFLSVVAVACGIFTWYISRH